MKGKKFLKVSSILMIIGGAISIILAIISIVGVAALAAIFESEGANMGLYYAYGGLLLVASIIQLIAGIKGVSASGKPEKAASCVIWGVLVAILSIVSMILGVVSGGDFKIVTLLTSLVLPVLYVIGAIQLKKSAN